jgi:hypothetical protein
MNMRFLFAAALAAVLFMSPTGQAVFDTQAVRPVGLPTAAEPPRCMTDMDFRISVDPYPTTEQILTPPRLTEDVAARLRLLGRLAQGVRQIGRWHGGGAWWECGRPLRDAEQEDAAIAWASRIVELAASYSDRGSADGIEMNPWEIAGIAANETGFDRCVLGKWPRKWGYEHGTMERSRLGISHTYADVERTLTDPRGLERWAVVGLDASPLHLVWTCAAGLCRPKFNRENLPPIPMQEVFSLGAGFEYGVRSMKKLAIDRGTSTPSLYWKGYRCEWYAEKIKRWARSMGAKRGEI